MTRFVTNLTRGRGVRSEYAQQLLKEPIPREWAFPESEYRERLATVHKAMDQQGIDVLLVHSVVDMCYLAGYQTLWPDVYACLIVPRDGSPFMQISEFEVGCAVLHGPIQEFETLPHWGELEKDRNPGANQLAKILEGRGFSKRRIGVQKGRLEVGYRGSLDAAAYERLKDLLPNAIFVDVTQLMFGIRVKKSPAEIEVMHRAGEITCAGMKASIDATAVGVLDNDIASAGASAMLAAGSEFFSIDPIVSAGHRSGFLHTTWKRYRIKAGDLVMLEFGGVYQRYTSPLMRTVSLGQPTDLVRRVVDALLDSRTRLYENVKPGRTVHEVAIAAGKALVPITDVGYSVGFHAYSIGLGFPPTWTDGPMYIMEGNEQVLEPGMTFHSPATVRFAKEWGAGFSESFVVTEGGCEFLTRGVERQLVIKQGR
jgi:Xaa-Pro dipeptidase